MMKQEARTQEEFKREEIVPGFSGFLLQLQELEIPFRAFSPKQKIHSGICVNM